MSQTRQLVHGHNVRSNGCPRDITGTESGSPFDYFGVDCETAREAISALLDNELTRTDGRCLDEHLEGCRGCRDWQARAHEVTRISRLELARPVPTRSDDLIVAVLARGRSPRRPTSLTWARFGLVAVAIAQAAITAPVLLYGRDHAAPVHVAHEEGAFATALAVGFLVAAWRPERARGMRALIGATAALLVVTAVADLFGGRTGIGDEAPHLLAVVGGLLVAYVAAATPTTSDAPSRSSRPVIRTVAVPPEEVGAPSRLTGRIRLRRRRAA